MSVLSKEAAVRIAERVRRAESATRGELVVAVVASSADYAFFRCAAAWLISLGVALEGAALADVDARWILLGVLALSAFLYALFGLGTFVRLLVPKRTRDAAVRDRALSAFVELGVAETVDRSGVLLLVSEREHRVELLADRGIYERLTKERLDAELRGLTEDFRAGRFEEGLGKVIDSVGEVLAREFPVVDGARNELSDEVRRLPER